VRIATWNVNSIRARQARLLGWLASARPDVLCLQELKCTDADFPADAVREAGYEAVWHGQKTYNGVAILARAPLTDVTRGLGDGEEEGGARVIAATVGGVRVVSCYAPNGQEVDSAQYTFKLGWYRRLRRFLDAHARADAPLALCGDWNVAPEDLDTYDPKAWEGQTLFTPREKEALAHLRGFGLTDTFRHLHPDAQQFSWWDYRMLAFPKNKGLRIDHVYATAPLLARLTAAGIDREARKGAQPSDHTPVWAEFRDA
jgi:exodeoxyribonuclease-3